MPHPVHALCLQQILFSGVTTIAYRIFPGYELKAWNLLLQVTKSRAFPNEMESFVLWLSTFQQRHHAVVEMYYKPGQRSMAGSSKLPTYSTVWRGRRWLLFARGITR